MSTSRSTKTLHAENDLFKPFIDRLNSEKLELREYENGVSCFIKGKDSLNQKRTTKVEIELREGKVTVFHYIDDVMQNRFHKPKKIGKNQFAIPEPKSDLDLFEDFFNIKSTIEIEPQEPNDVNYDRKG